jgi:hypothetical protein
MEDAMRLARIVTTGALVAAVLGAAIASAAAQSAAQPSGAPLPLLQFSQKKTKATPPAHPKIAAKSEHKPVAKRLVVARRPTAARPQAVAAAPQTPEPAAANALPANAQPTNMWPTTGTIAPGMTGTLAPPQPGPAVSTVSVVQTSPNEIVSGGHAVQVTSPDQINAADLAADNHEQTANTAASTDPASPQPVATATVARVETPEMPTPVGSASWFAQVLAALGGALAAGVVAWFLIRPAAIRTYN